MVEVTQQGEPSAGGGLEPSSRCVVTIAWESSGGWRPAWPWPTCGGSRTPGRGPLLGRPGGEEPALPPSHRCRARPTNAHCSAAGRPLGRAADHGDFRCSGAFFPPFPFFCLGACRQAQLQPGAAGAGHPALHGAGPGGRRRGAQCAHTHGAKGLQGDPGLGCGCLLVPQPAAHDSGCRGRELPAPFGLGAAASEPQSGAPRPPAPPPLPFPDVEGSPVVGGSHGLNCLPTCCASGPSPHGRTCLVALRAPWRMP